MQHFAAYREILGLVPGHNEPPDQRTPAPHTQKGIRPPIWLGDDPVIQLRPWAENSAHRIPDLAEVVIGSDPSADLPLDDPKRLLSRKHARLVREEDLWVIEDHSKNGIKCDGGRAPGKRFLLVPGLELGLGGLTLVAENATLVGLRGYLARVLGWDAKTRKAIDVAMRAIRAAGNRREPLMLAGVDDLVAVARQIHIRTTPLATPFVVCASKERESDTSIRVTATVADPSAAIAEAAGGTVCVRANKLPAGYDELLSATSDLQTTAQLFICAQKVSKHWDHLIPPVTVPKLARRTAEDLRRIIREYALDARHELDAGPTAFTEQECEWVGRHESGTFADIEIATLRLVAFNAAPNPHQAAAHLGISHTGLGSWLSRRGLTK